MFLVFASIAVEPATMQPELLVPTVGNPVPWLSLLLLLHTQAWPQPTTVTIPLHASSHASYLGLKSLKIGGCYKNPLCLSRESLWSWTQLLDSSLSFHHMCWSFSGTSILILDWRNGNILFQCHDYHFIYLIIQLVSLFPLKSCMK